MALVLSLREDEIFYIEDTPFIVRNISKESFNVDNLITNKRYLVDGSKMIELYPGVKASAGHYTKYKTVKLVVEAPKEIIITREERRNADT